ncbi:MAG: virulence protein RhuM/Fic/DOC family protein [Flavobacteriales bacterium]|nr:virulence protein RhuM/Fic/DOC family protein [Flavobacteriales bacterium]
MKEENQIVIYQTNDGQTQIDVKLQHETIWLSQRQMAELFEKDSDTIGLHLKNIFESEELEESTTTEYFSVVQKEGNRLVKRNLRCYNLDAILSVGYRVNSKRGTQFRIWANRILKDFLVKGHAINEKRLKEAQQQFSDLKKTVKLLEKVANQKLLSSDEATGLLKVITDYSYALDVLDKYDHRQLAIEETTKTEIFRINYSEALIAINRLRISFGGSSLFGHEKDKSFKGSLSAIYQTFDGVDLYPSIEEKGAHLLYFIVKNHSFSDGNKRIAAFIFVWFLERNHLLYSEEGQKRMADNALVALTLMIAESEPKEKDMMIKVIVNLINRNN